MNVTFVEGDTGTIIRWTVKDSSGNKVDITGASSLKFRWMQSGVLQERALEIKDAQNGVATYVLQAGDLLEAEKLYFELEYVSAAGNRYTTPHLDGPHEVRKALGA